MAAIHDTHELRRIPDGVGWEASIRHMDALWKMFGGSDWEDGEDLTPAADTVARLKEERDALKVDFAEAQEAYKHAMLVNMNSGVEYLELEAERDKAVAALAEVGAYINRCLEDDAHFPLFNAVVDIKFYYQDVARLLWSDEGDKEEPTND